MAEGPKPDDGEKIDSTFRNGSLTAVGIIAGFSLSFLSRWAANPANWGLYDLVAVVPLVIGIAFQIKALADLLSIRSLRLANYNRAKRSFLIGVGITALGVAAAIAIDTLGISRSDLI